jgi:hypothetical protein
MTWDLEGCDESSAGAVGVTERLRLVVGLDFPFLKKGTVVGVADMVVEI